ncbi:unnamed protein product [Prorocentrum cordatum]|uniref:Uncharacterized protein n=1 Tax=Prorocentrum cordatum TaxID=2364126 RepID=A0ABN9RLS9_9DINO|nr:unnamed protein product [Polarella glacialis]
MVVPLAVTSGAADVMPPEESRTYRMLLGGLAVGYFIVIVMGLVSGSVDNVINDIFVCVVAAAIAQDARRVGQCSIMFAIFACLVTIFNVIQFIGLLSAKNTIESPGASYLFSLDCPYDVTLKVGQATNVTVTSDGRQITLPQNYDGVQFHFEHMCNWRWVVGNVSTLLSLLLDLLASAIGCKLWRTVRGGVGGDGGLLQGPGGGMPGMPPAGGPGGGGGGPGFAGFGGQGNTLGGGPGARAAPGGPGQVGGPRAGLFQGQGQTLGS